MPAATAVPALAKTSAPAQVPEPKKNNAAIFCDLLRPEEYADWDRLVDRSVHGTVFHHSWWLKAASPDFRLLVVRDRDRLLGGLPLPKNRSSFLKLYHSPLLTPYLGPIFDLTGITNNYDRLFAMRSQGELLAHHLPSFDTFRQLSGACGPDLQGFLWSGFSVQLAYTFRFSSHSSLEEIASAMSRTHAQKLSKAKRLKLTVHKSSDIEILISLNTMIFARQKRQPPYSAELVRRLWLESSARNCGRLYVAHAADGIPVAALFTVNDDRSTYQIVSGVNTAMPDVPGGNVVLWTAIQEAIQEGRDFDFEGSSLRGVEVYYRRWGAAAVPVWRLEKSGSVRGALIQAVIQRRLAASHASVNHAA